MLKQATYLFTVVRRGTFIVMDVVENSAHKKQFLLAQSFMPAQNIQVLQYGSPWFSMDRHSDILYGELITPFYLRKFD